MLDLGVMSGAIGPATTGAGLGEGAVGGCPEDGGWVGMEAGSGRGVIIGLSFNGSLAMCWRSSSMVHQGGCMCTGMHSRTPVTRTRITRIPH